MNTAIISFETASLPAYLKTAVLSDDLGASFSNFPRLSIKGKVFHITRGEEKTLITKPGEEDPAASIEVVLIKAYPAGNLYAKAFYSAGYSEGAADKPVCYSNDGISPAADSEEKQANKCALCPQAQKGSKITDNGKPSKACASSKKLAVAQPGAINDVMFLRVPGESTIALGDYGDILKKRGMPYQAVVTRIGFDYSVAHPALTFKPVGFISEEAYAEAMEQSTSDLVLGMVGAKATLALPKPVDDEPFEQTAPKAAEAPKPAPKPAAKPAPAEEPAEPKAAPKAAEAPKPAPKPKPAPVVEAITEIDEGMSASLDDLDFDD